jgi:hypothetical protein
MIGVEGAALAEEASASEVRTAPAMAARGRNLMPEQSPHQAF